MNSFMDKMGDALLPIANKVGNQRHLLAIRDAFTTIMPLMIIGALVVAINNLPIEAFQNLMNSIFAYTLEDGSHIWKNLGGNVWNGTFGIMSLFMAYLIGDNLGTSYGMNGKTAGATSLASFATIGGMAGVSSSGLFIAIIVALLSVELLKVLSSIDKLKITMPEGVPAGVASSFNSMIPMMLVIVAVGLITTILVRVGIPNVVEVFYENFQKPFMGLSSTLPAALILAVVPTFLWFFGIHGANMIDPVMQLINAPAIEANNAAIAAGKAAENIVNKPFFDSFVNMGGTGATIALLIAMFIIGRKNKKMMTMASLSIGPGIFNINEPLTFGLPIVLNPIYFIPYVFGPVVLAAIAYFATSSGLVPVCTVVTAWVTPPVIGGLLATASWKGGLLAAFNLVVMICIYLPFVYVANKQDMLEIEQEASNN